MSLVTRARGCKKRLPPWFEMASASDSQGAAGALLLGSTEEPNTRNCAGSNCLMRVDNILFFQEKKKGR